jgi:hypothetical protein
MNSMAACVRNPTKCNRGKWFFLSAFLFACFLFWWLPSLLFRAVVHQADAVENGTIAISVLAMVFFVAGYLFPVPGRTTRKLSEPTLNACGELAYGVTILVAIPALVLAVQFWRSHAGMSYGFAAIDPIPSLYQAVLYTHLFFGFMYLGTANPEIQGWRRILTVSILVALPRLIISLHWGRFFLAQAILPALLIAIARGWVRFTLMRLLQIAVLAMAILFVPSLTRGDSLTEQGEIANWFAAGSSLQLFQDNTDLSLMGRCPPLLVSLTAKTIPYGMLGVCVLDLGTKKNVPASLDYILTINDPINRNGIASGTGSNYLLELYLFGGLPAVYVGSALFGFSSRRFVGWIGMRSLFCGIWAECLTRALFAPRGDLGYVYERIPSLILTTLLVVAFAWATRLLRINWNASSAVQNTAKGEPNATATRSFNYPRLHVQGWTTHED